MRKIELFDTTERPRLHVGLRMVKTVLAVYLSAMLVWFALGGTRTPFFAMIATLLCVQPTRTKSLFFAFNRTIGTILGGICGALCLYAAQLLEITSIIPLYYLFICIVLIPIIHITLLIRKPTVSAFACIVFLSVTVVQMQSTDPFIYALYRSLETLSGVLVALVINWFLPSAEAEAAESCPVPEDSGNKKS